MYRIVLSVHPARLCAELTTSYACVVLVRTLRKYTIVHTSMGKKKKNNMFVRAWPVAVVCI